jgi:hypothetical protein
MFQCCRRSDRHHLLVEITSHPTLLVCETHIPLQRFKDGEEALYPTLDRVALRPHPMDVFGPDRSLLSRSASTGFMEGPKKRSDDHRGRPPCESGQFRQSSIFGFFFFFFLSVFLPSLGPSGLTGPSSAVC